MSKKNEVCCRLASRTWCGVDSLRACYQPILSLTDGLIVGHEVLGRQERDGRLLSLGGFFASRHVPDEEKLAVDRRIRRHALQQAVDEGYKGQLFLNIKPEWVLDSPDDRYPTIRFVEEVGLDPSQIVIEITEDLFAGEIRDLYRKVRLYSEAGFHIAIDDFQFQHIDRLLELRPDIVKVDRALVADLARNAGTGHFLEYIASFAADSGIAILFEGVETEEELKAAYGAGLSLSRASFSLRHRNTLPRIHLTSATVWFRPGLRCSSRYAIRSCFLSRWKAGWIRYSNRCYQIRRRPVIGRPTSWMSFCPDSSSHCQSIAFACLSVMQPVFRCHPTWKWMKRV